MALVDLYWAANKDRKRFNCDKCRESTKIQRNCREPGYENLAPGKYHRVDDQGVKFRFCPGKATWSPTITSLFHQCRTTQITGHLPLDGGLDDQPEMFTEVYPVFVERWQERSYARVWRDVGEFSPEILKQFGKMFSSLFGGKRGKGR